MTQQAAPSTAGGPDSDILLRLRTESRAEHEAIEHELDLMAPGLTRARYVARLERFYGFYAPLEARLEARGAFPGSESGPQPKTPLLVADLRALGAGPPDQLPLCTALPPLASPAEVLGCLYVLEGASLGGQVISRHLRRTLGISRENGGRFFSGYGEATGVHWRAFMASLVAFAREHGQQDLLVRSALLTFRAMRSFCREGAAHV